jgi:uncharacterized membrane-anchored protein
VQANAIALAEASDFEAYLLDGPGYFMTKRYRQIVRAQKSAAVMRIRVTNAGSADANQHIVRTNLWRLNFAKLKRAADFR